MFVPTGFSIVDDAAVYKVCDQPHPVILQELIGFSLTNNLDEASKRLATLWRTGYSAIDIISTIFKVVKFHDMPEKMKLAFIKEIGYTHMRYAFILTST